MATALAYTPEQIDALDPQVRDTLRASVTPHWNKYVAQHPLFPLPNYRQYAFVCLDVEEAMYGGAAGGAKSSALLMLAMQYVDVPGYHAIIFRRTYEDLSRSGALIPRSHEWLSPYRRSGEVRWNGHNRWTFPSGATLEFGYLDNDKDPTNYQSAEFSFIGFDELTQFKEPWYRYLFSRKRKLVTLRNVPTRIRSATNPGGIGHEWVHQRFLVEGPRQRRIFVPSRLEDNPYLDKADYEKGLSNLDPVTYEQLRHGNWSIREPGSFFRREWFGALLDAAPAGGATIRMWDLAATKNQTSAYTAGALLTLKDGVMYLRDMRRIRGDPGEVQNLIVQTAQLDGRNVPIWIEQEPGSGGVNTLYQYQHVRELTGYAVHAYHPKHDKLTRAGPLSAAAHAGTFRVVRGDYAITTFFDELETFPHGLKDQVDTCSAGLQVLAQRPQFRIFPL